MSRKDYDKHFDGWIERNRKIREEYTDDEFEETYQQGFEDGKKEVCSQREAYMRGFDEGKKAASLKLGTNTQDYQKGFDAGKIVGYNEAQADAHERLMRIANKCTPKEES